MATEFRIRRRRKPDGTTEADVVTKTLEHWWGADDKLPQEFTMDTLNKSLDLIAKGCPQPSDIPEIPESGGPEDQGPENALKPMILTAFDAWKAYKRGQEPNVDNPPAWAKPTGPGETPMAFAARAAGELAKLPQAKAAMESVGSGYDWEDWVAAVMRYEHHEAAKPAADVGQGQDTVQKGVEAFDALERLGEADPVEKAFDADGAMADLEMLAKGIDRPLQVGPRGGHFTQAKPGGPKSYDEHAAHARALSSEAHARSGAIHAGATPANWTTHEVAMQAHHVAANAHGNAADTLQWGEQQGRHHREQMKHSTVAHYHAQAIEAIKNGQPAPTPETAMKHHVPTPAPAGLEGSGAWGYISTGRGDNPVFVPHPDWIRKLKVGDAVPHPYGPGRTHTIKEISAQKDDISGHPYIVMTTHDEAGAKAGSSTGWSLKAGEIHAGIAGVLSEQLHLAGAEMRRAQGIPTPNGDKGWEHWGDQHIGKSLDAIAFAEPQSNPLDTVDKDIDLTGTPEAERIAKGMAAHREWQSSPEGRSAAAKDHSNVAWEHSYHHASSGDDAANDHAGAANYHREAARLHRVAYSAHAGAIAPGGQHHEAMAYHSSEAADHERQASYHESKASAAPAASTAPVAKALDAIAKAGTSAGALAGWQKRHGQAASEGFTATDADPTELALGIAHEVQEHGMSLAEAERTALDHLSEDPLYYAHLEEMEERHEGPAVQDESAAHEAAETPAEQAAEQAAGDDDDTLSRQAEESGLQEFTQDVEVLGLPPAGDDA